MRKVVLAYSGGLDTSVILEWLKENYNAEVITFTADIGQSDDFDLVKTKAQNAGVRDIFIENLQEEFVRDYVFPMLRANATYETYLLGTAIARPLIAKRQVEIAKQLGAEYIAHGATGKGNDQVRFEISAYALHPEIKIISPWREWNLSSRTKLLEYARNKNIEIPESKINEPPYSIDANLMHTSYEGKDLEDPWREPKYNELPGLVMPEDASEISENIEIEFRKGDPIAINEVQLKPVAILSELNRLGIKHGIGYLDLVENRFVGMKSRGVYHTPGGEILMRARHGLETITLDRESIHLKDDIALQYARLIYNGMWFSPERNMMQAAIDRSQENVTGIIRLKLYKGIARVIGRRSDSSLYSHTVVSFDSDSDYNHRDAEGFIKLNALRLRMLKQNY